MSRGFRFFGWFLRDYHYRVFENRKFVCQTKGVIIFTCCTARIIVTQCRIPKLRLVTALIPLWSHWARTISRPINKSSQWHQWKCLTTVWTLLHITMKLILTVLSQCDRTIRFSATRIEHWTDKLPTIRQLYDVFIPTDSTTEIDVFTLANPATEIQKVTTVNDHNGLNIWLGWW